LKYLKNKNNNLKMKNPVLILGAGPLGKTALDIFNKNEVMVFGFLDDDTSKVGTEIDEIVVLGQTDNEGFTKLIGQKCEAFVANDDTNLKKHQVKMLTDRRHTMPVNALDPSAALASNAVLGHGNLIAAKAVIGSHVQIGNHCNILSGAVLEPDCHLADFVQIGTNASLGAGVQVAEGAFVGQGAVIVGGILIGKNARVGAGSVVIENVADNQTVFGNPAKKI
jgi:sugar O-acyltransferase (sialic acid O-acetyltransferase NeuD family)